MYDVYMYVNMYMKILANLSNFCTVSISRQPHHHINVFFNDVSFGLHTLCSGGVLRHS